METQHKHDDRNMFYVEFPFPSFPVLVRKHVSCSLSEVGSLDGQSYVCSNVPHGFKMVDEKSYGALPMFVCTCILYICHVNVHV